MENSLKVPQETKSEVAIWSTSLISGHIFWENYKKFHEAQSANRGTIYNSHDTEAT